VAEGSHRVLPYGAHAALVELADLDEVLVVYAALRAEPPEGVVELVPAARTILLDFDPRRTSLDRLSTAIAGMRVSGQRSQHPELRNREQGEEVEVPVHYDGPDLAEVARSCGLDEAAVVALHTAGRYRSGFCGFSPGFAYLTGLDERLHVSRRDEPRTRVRAGSVGLADEFTAIYPQPSPGGWRLIGHTSLATWDLARDPPALLAPGTAVRFVDAGS